MQDLRAVGATWLFQWHAKRLRVKALLVRGSYDGVLTAPRSFWRFVGPDYGVVRNTRLFCRQVKMPIVQGH